MKEPIILDIKTMCEMAQVYDVGISVRFFADRIGIEVRKQDPKTKLCFEKKIAVGLTALEDGTFGAEAYANYMANKVCEATADQDEAERRHTDGES